MRSANILIRSGKNEFIHPVVVAETVAEQRQGLMGNKTPQTMVFDFKDAGIYQFWMKNTPAPLDIVFCAPGGIVVDIVSGIPYSEDSVGPHLPVNLVIEFPAGFCNSKNIRNGDFIKLL